jgi:wyosine [tRNA(Phe)-imidazoG37] synthetase (radical SAM superfamily)
LGRSLGVSPIPRKACTYSCVYCQLGATQRRRIRRASFFRRVNILDDILRSAEQDQPDVITFVGDGEPTLSLDLGWLIGECKRRLHLPVAVITNGSLLGGARVRDAVTCADIVCPSLDAGDERTFRRVNRPHHSLSFDGVVEGLRKFRAQYSGIIRLEIMLIRGLNDSARQLRTLREFVSDISPDHIDLSVPIRPPAESWVEPPAPDRILAAERIFNDINILDGKEHGPFGLSGFESVLSAIRHLSSRHPLHRDQANEIAKAFSMPGEIDRLIESGELKVKTYSGLQFILPSAGHGD